MSSAPPYRCWVEVSRRQLVENLQAVRAAAGPGVDVMAVVKADAYRHGAVEVSRVLVGEGVRWLAVSSVEEGVALREAGIEARILVMAGILPGEMETLIANRLTPAVHSLGELRSLPRAVTRYHLKVDTGLSRLGTRAAPEQIVQAVREAGPERLEGLMTHYASAADFTRDQTDRQMAGFLRVWEALRAAGIQPECVHVSSTNALAYRSLASWQTMVRPGYALYGFVSPPRGDAPCRRLAVKPVLTWKAAVLAVKEVPEGAEIGYGAIFRAPRPMRIALLAAGYADGYPHRLTNRGKVIVKGTLAPVLGAVSMDLTTIDVTGCPPVEPGDAATLLGREGDVEIDAFEMARMAGTISYNVLCGISARVKRLYV